MNRQNDTGWAEVRTDTQQEITQQTQNDCVGENSLAYPALTRPTPEAFLPSWIKTSLGCVVEYGKVEKAEPSEIHNDTWVLELEDIEKDNSKIIQRLTFLDRQSKSTKNRFKKGDVLYGKLRPYLNKVVIAESDGVCTTEVIPLSGSEYLHNKYLFYWLKHPSFLSYVTQVGYGVNMPRLGTKEGIAAPFILAPIAEQQQIAAKLDELLAQVDSIKTRLDAIPKILKRFRQSVLAAAVSGKLTEDWRGLKPFGNTVTIGDVATDIRYGTSKKCDYGAGKTPVIRIPNIDNGILNLNNLKHADFDEKELKSLALEKGDILLIRSNGSVDLVGKAALITEKEVHCLFAGYLIRIRLNKQMVFPKYLLFCLLSVQIRKVIEIQARSTSGVNNINSKELAALEFVLPSIEEQSKIVNRVEQLFAYADQIEQRVKDAQSRVNHLTQSILAKAFRGELTADWRAQNPELISGENSAEALLAKILAERDGTVTRTPGKRKLRA